MLWQFDYVIMHTDRWRVEVTPDQLGIPFSSKHPRTLSHSLSSIRSMPPQINIDAHKDLVLSLHADNISLAEICKVLQERHRVSITCKTLRRRLDEWGVVTEVRAVYRRSKDGELRERVRKFVCEDKFSTKVRSIPIARDVVRC
jgi:hypothetical protein